MSLSIIVIPFHTSFEVASRFADIYTKYFRILTSINITQRAYF
ncbi:hypothetical protein J2S70_000245 [Trueperella bonasi]|uniref:Uncharacterized protein n=1 Tax=Trueperella bonasi TaxID=312286 RepID=A0ABT9NF42_9ACTO|nr:hypothetical protein [Trueperella bonasi]